MATFTSKTLIPGQTPIGQNRDGSYIYEEVMSKATTAPKATTPIYTPPTAIAKIPTDGKTNFMPLVTPENARKPNAPVKDSLGIAKKVNEADERVKQLKQHFQYLEQNGEFYLNDKQSDYIKKFKQKYPDYSSVPDVSLYSKIILAEPKAMQTYGNIGERTAGDKFRDITMGNIEVLGDAVGEGIDAWKDYRESVPDKGKLENAMREGVALGSGAGKFLGDSVIGVGGNILNLLPVAPDAKKGTTYTTEYLGNEMAKELPEVANFIFSPGKKVVDFLKGEGYSDKRIAEIKEEIVNSEGFKKLMLELQNNPNGRAAMNIANILPGGIFNKGGSAARNKIIGDLSEKGIAKFTNLLADEAFEAQTKGKFGQHLLGAGKKFTDDVARGIEDTQSYIDNAPTRAAEVAADPQVIEQNTIKNREVLDGIRDTITGKKILAKADDFGNDPKDDIARYEDFQPEIDEDGRVHTDRAVENVETKYIAPKGKTVRSLIEAEGKRVSLEEFRAKTLKEIESNIDDIVNYDDWVKYINKSIDSAKKFVDENGTIALEKIDDIKKKVQSQNKYLNPNDTANKALARGARKMIEENVESADIAALNKEIARFYAIRDYLEAIGTGKTIKGGRFGKYSSKFGGQFIGAVAGGLIGGPAGAVVGGAAAGEAADIIKGKLLSSAIKSTGAIGVPESEAFAAARGTLDEAPKLLEGPSGNPTSYPSIYSREAEQLGRGEFPGNNNTQLGDFATPKSVTPVVSGPGSSLAVSVDNGTIDIKKALEQFDKLNPEEKAKALNGSDKLRELVKVTTEIKDIQEFKGDFGYTPPEIIDSLGDNYLNYSPEAKEIIRKGLDKEDLATLQKMNREKAGLPEPVVEEKAKVTETKELPKKVTDLEEEIGMLDDNKGDRSSFVQKYDGSDEYGTAGDAYDAVKDMDRFEFEDYASLWKDKDGGGMIPKNETASKIIDDIDGFADKLGISSDGAITLIRDGTGGSRYKENLANFKARYGVAPFQAKKKLAQFKKAWEAGKNPSIDDFLYKSEKTVDFSKPSKEEMAIENSKTPFDDDPVSPLAKKEPTPTETIEEAVSTPETVKESVEVKEAPKTPQVEGKTLKDNLEWTPNSKLDQDIFYVDRNGIRQTEFESAGKNIKGQRTGYTMEEYLNKNGLSKDDFTLSKGTDGADGLYVLNEKGLSKLEKLRAGNKPKPSPLSQKSEVKYSKPEKFIKEVDEERIIFKTKDGKSSAIITETTPNYEFADDITEKQMEKLGVDPDDFIMKLEDIRVDEAKLGQGIGGQLMDEVINNLKKSGADFVYLNASPMGYKGMKLDVLTKWYEKYGFKVFKRQGNNNLMYAKISNLK